MSIARPKGAVHLACHACHARARNPGHIPNPNLSCIMPVRGRAGGAEEDQATHRAGPRRGGRGAAGSTPNTQATPGKPEGRQGSNGDGKKERGAAASPTQAGRCEPEGTQRQGAEGQQPAERGGGGSGHENPRETLARDAASGVRPPPPPRRPYPPHLSSRNKVRHARERWSAARGGPGRGGWPMGLTRSTTHGTYCVSCPVRGCAYGTPSIRASKRNACPARAPLRPTVYPTPVWGTA